MLIILVRKYGGLNIVIRRWWRRVWNLKVIKKNVGFVGFGE